MPLAMILSDRKYSPLFSVHWGDGVGASLLDVFHQKHVTEALDIGETFVNLPLGAVDQDQVAVAELRFHAVAPDGDHGEVGELQSSSRWDVGNVLNDLNYMDDLDRPWIKSMLRLAARAITSMEPKELRVLDQLDGAIRRSSRKEELA